MNPAVTYAGKAVLYGTSNDPLVGQRPGGVNVFGGGLALYNPSGVLVGALGVSGDTARPDNIVYDITPAPGQMEGVSASGWGHPQCVAAATAISKTLPQSSTDDYTASGSARTETARR